MNTKKHAPCRLPLSAAFFLVLISSTALYAQQADSATPTGAPEDWTHRHLIYSNPGSAEDALRNGDLDNWYKITADPRYKIQQLKRGARRPASVTASELAPRTALIGITRPVPLPGSVKRPVGTLKRDWSMSYGGGSAAVLTAVVGSTINSSTLPSGASFTIDSQTFASNDPTSSSATLTVSSLPATTDKVTITNGANSFVISENGTAISSTGTFVGQPTGAALGTVVVGANTYNLATTASAASYSEVLDVGSGTTTTGSITYSYTGVAGSTYTFTLTGGGSNACAHTSGTAYTGTWATTSNDNTAGSNFRTALGDCVSAASLTSHFAVGGTAGTATLTDNFLGAFLTVTANTLTNDTPTATAGNNGTSAACSGTGPYTVDYVVSSSLSTMASNLYTELHASGCSTTGITASYTSGASLTVGGGTNVGGSVSSSDTSKFTFTGTTGGNGSNACTSAQSTGNTFGTGSTTALVATAISDAINACSAAIQAITGVNALSTTSTNMLTIYTYIPGTTGGSGITLGSTSFGNRTTAIAVSGGTNGAANSSTGFQYWSGNTYVSQSQLATNIVAALGLNSTITTDFTIGAANSPATGDIRLISNTGGTAGNSYALSPSSFTALTGGSFSGGSDGVAADMGAEIFPAKYSFNGPPSCSDFVAYTTGVTGGASGPTLIAYNNIYEGASPSCGTVGVPTVYWQYNTAYPSGGGSTDSSYINTSPVLSGNGTQLAFIQTTGSAASLVILKWASNSSLVQLNTAANNVTPANYPTCAAPCMTRIAFNAPSNDTISSPFYDYGTDIIYVGDASGNLHQFTNVFSGTGSGSSYPKEVLGGGWPVPVNSGNALTSPVYDPVSGLVFVANMGTAGYLYSVNSAGTKVQSYKLAVSPGISEGPVVDSTAEEVYVYVPVDTNTSTSLSCVNASGCNGVYQLPATFTAATSWNESVMGQETTTEPVFAGDFDNQYYSSETSNPTKPTGNLYVCGTYGGGVNEPKLMDATIASGIFTPESGSTAKPSSDGHGTVYFATNVAKPMTSAAAACSSVTENFDGTNDWIFMSVSNSGSLTATTTATCTGACIYSWNVTTTLAFQNGGTTITQPTQGLAASGGTGGIIIDNASSQAGASQIYFGTLGAQTCMGNGLGPGTGSTGGCAVQASQNGLN